MALKGGNDIPRAQDPRIVLEVTLLRMASAPKLLDLKVFCKWTSALSQRRWGQAGIHSAGSSPQSRGHQRLQESQKVSEVPEGLDAMKSALEKVKPSTPKENSQNVSVATPLPEKPQPKMAVGASAQEKWVHFVDLIRQDDALFAAKVENLLFVKEEGKLLSLAVPAKLAFLKEQMAERSSA